MTDRIKKLSIQSFRGATQPFELQFDASKPVVLIFGENGTGKSTIVDALECVGSGSTAFLDDWKLGKGKRKESYIPTLGKTLTDVKIALEFGNKTYSATLNAGGIGLCNTPGRPQTKVLRRKSLQAFIDADPAQRYKEVATFLDIPQIVASEASLRKAYKHAKDTFDSATSAKRQAHEALHGLWEAEGSPGLFEDEKNKTFNTAEAWARSQTKLEVESLELEFTGIRTGVKHCENVIRNFQSYEQVIEEFKQAEEKLKLAQQQLAKLEAGDAKSNAQLVTLLEDAKDYLQVNPDKLCPVCEQTEIEAGSLVKRLEQRIDGMDSLKQANAAIKSVSSSQKTKLELLQRAEKSLLNAAESAQIHFEKELTENVSIKAQREKDLTQALALAAAVKIDLSAKQPKLQTQLDGLQKQIHTLTSIKQLVTTLDEKKGEAKQAEQLQLKLGQAVQIFESKRKAYVETVLLEIAQSVDELYQKIHPDEKLGNLKLKLDEKQRGSLVYRVAFEDRQDIQPQPYYSESHLDTLGLCIFLALAKRGRADKAIVILDDVLGSVDQQHLSRTLQMILEESDSFAQIVFTTHYRPLRNRFINSRTGSAKVQLIDLKSWTSENGIRYVTPELAIDELDKLLNDENVPRSQIAIDAGRLLESMFDYICLLFGLRMTSISEP